MCSRGWHQGGRRGAAREHRHRVDEVHRVRADRRRRRCWPRRSTRSPTPATRCCCSSAASAGRRGATEEHPFGFGRERYIYAFIVSIVLFTRRRSVRAVRGVPQVPRDPRCTVTPRTPCSTAPGGGCRWRCWRSRSSMESLSFRTAIIETNKVRGDASIVAVHPARQAARAAGDPAGGLRRTARSAVRAARRGLTLITEQRLLRRGRHRHDRRCCWSWSRSRWPSRPRACCSASRRPPRPRSTDPHGARRRRGIDRVIHMKTLHLGPEELLVAVKIGVRPRHRRSRWPRRHRRRRAGHPGGRADRPGHLPRARHLPRRPRPRRASRAPSARRSLSVVRRRREGLAGSCGWAGAVLT